MMKKVISFLVLAVLISCNTTTKNYHNGTYALVINMFGVNVNTNSDNPKKNIIVNGNKIIVFGDEYSCKQYPDRIVVNKGDFILNISE